MPVFTCNGNDMADVYKATLDAATYARKRGAPATVVYKNITRRFGHAATDRQAAYLSSNEITNAYTLNPLSNICKQVIEANIIDLTTLSNRFNEFTDIVESSFQEASLEPKVNSRKDLVNRNSAILAKVPKTRAKKSDVDDGEKIPGNEKAHDAFV